MDRLKAPAILLGITIELLAAWLLRLPTKKSRAKTQRLLGKIKKNMKKLILVSRHFISPGASTY